MPESNKVDINNNLKSNTGYTDKKFILNQATSLLGLGIFMLVLSINKLYLLNIVAVFIFIVLLFTKTLENVVRYQFYALLTSVLVVDNLWIATPIAVPLYLRYIPELINIVLFFKLLNIKEKKNSYSDKAIYLCSILFFFNLVSFVVADYPFLDFINGTRIYFRWIILYIAIKKSTIRFANLVSIYNITFVLQLALVLFQFIIYREDQDMISGTFGLFGNQYLLAFNCIGVFYYLFHYVQKKASFTKVFLVSASVLITAILSETKSVFVVIPSVAIILLIVSTKTKLIKKIAYCCFIVIIFVNSFSYLGKLYPDFANFFTKEKLEGYILRNNNFHAYTYGRIEVIEIIHKYIFEDKVTKVKGKGIGAALPSEFFFYGRRLKGRTIQALPGSTFHENNQYLGYEISSFATLYLENGMFGIFLFILLCIVFLSKARYVIKNSKKPDFIAFSYCNIGFILSFILLCVYSDILYNMQTSMILWIMNGLQANIYNQVKENTI